MTRRYVYLAIIFAVIIVVIGLYYFIDPAEAWWMPKCVFRQLTGRDCPACGNQRAIHALLHGDFSTAMQHNPFAIISIPYVALFAYTSFCRGRLSNSLKRYIQHRTTVNIYLVAIIAWWIVRNL